MKSDPVLEAWLAEDDEAFIRELSLFSIRNAFRPRDEGDMDVHPDSLRGKVLASYDAYDALPRWLRILSWLVAWRPWRRPA